MTDKVAEELIAIFKVFTSIGSRLWMTPAAALEPDSRPPLRCWKERPLFNFLGAGE